MSNYDKLPPEIKENILKYISYVDYNNMMLISKNNLIVGRNGRLKYIIENIKYQIIEIKVGNWLNIRNNPLISKLKLDAIIFGNCNENMIICLTGNIFNFDNLYYVDGKFIGTFKYNIYGQEHNLNLKCNFINNKLTGIYSTLIDSGEDIILSHINYYDNIRLTEINFYYGQTIVNFRNKDNNIYRQYIYDHPYNYLNKNELFDYYPQLNMDINLSFSMIDIFIFNLINGKYSEFILSTNKEIVNGIFTHRDNTLNIVDIKYINLNTKNNYNKLLFGDIYD